MAPKGGRGKSSKRKDKAAAALPVLMDVKVVLPDDSNVVLKGISTDRIIDIRRLVAVNAVTCNITNFSFSHQVR
ncbi:hypothetical protein M569_01096, partial [Genlisea aurea]